MHTAAFMKRVMKWQLCRDSDAAIIVVAYVSDYKIFIYLAIL